MSMESKLEANIDETVRAEPSLAPIHTQKWPGNLVGLILSELKVQRGIAIPLVVMNITWYARIAITTAFLGRLGELPLAGGALGATLSNVTGFSVLNGLCTSMEPICGQAFGAKNFKLLHKTLVMTIILLLVTALPISFLWLNIDKILILLGQQEDISKVAKRYLLYLLPDLVVYALLCPLKAYLSTQSITIPIMLSSGIGLALHVPFSIFLSKSRGLEGVSIAVWLSDLVMVILLGLYVLIAELRKGGKGKEGGWWDQGVHDWLRLMKICVPCCLTTCLEWWCYEILILLAGRLRNAKQAVGVLAIVLNFDYLSWSIMISLATCASIRISNELGANQAGPAYRSAYTSLGIAALLGKVASSMALAVRGIWGKLFSHDKTLIRQVKKMLLILALVEAFNYPLTVCGGIVRGTARPKLAMYANLTGFYFLALPAGVLLALKFHLGLAGILTGFLVGCMSCLFLLMLFIMRIGWEEEAMKARMLTSCLEKIDDPEDNKNCTGGNEVV